MKFRWLLFFSVLCVYLTPMFGAAADGPDRVPGELAGSNLDLHNALICHEPLPVIEYLLDHGHDVNALDAHGRTAINALFNCTAHVFCEYRGVPPAFIPCYYYPDLVPVTELLLKHNAHPAGNNYDTLTRDVLCTTCIMYFTHSKRKTAWFDDTVEEKNKLCFSIRQQQADLVKLFLKYWKCPSAAVWRLGSNTLPSEDTYCKTPGTWNLTTWDESKRVWVDAAPEDQVLTWCRDRSLGGLEYVASRLVNPAADFDPEHVRSLRDYLARIGREHYHSCDLRYLDDILMVRRENILKSLNYFACKIYAAFEIGDTRTFRFGPDMMLRFLSFLVAADIKDLFVAITKAHQKYTGIGPRCRFDDVAQLKAPPAAPPQPRPYSPPYTIPSPREFVVRGSMA